MCPCSSCWLNDKIKPNTGGKANTLANRCCSFQLGAEHYLLGLKLPLALATVFTATEEASITHLELSNMQSPNL